MLRSISRSLSRSRNTVITQRRGLATVLNPSTTTPSSPADESPVTSPPLKPQPFIPRPISRSGQYQLESITVCPEDPTRSTRLHFIDPTSPSTSPSSVSLPNLFLRDSSIHPSHVHPSSQQKLFRTTDVPIEGKLIGYGVHDVPGRGECLVTEWSTPLETPGMDPKSVTLSVVELEVLKGLMLKRGGEEEERGKLPKSRIWNRRQLDQTLVTISYHDFLSSDKHLLTLLDGLIQDGIVFLTDMPTDQKEGHSTELRRAVERIGSLRRTWYGDLWDVKAEEGSKNIAYTNLDLGLHMDLTHFDHPPRYQFLHSLLNHQITGGSSYFVDSYAIAQHLEQHDPQAFETLSKEMVQFEYKNGPHWTRWKRPTFEFNNDNSSSSLITNSTSTSKTLSAVNYSPPFQGRLPLTDSSRLVELHRSLRQFARLCDDTDEEGTWRFSHQLQPGECVIFDNRRVLHARTAFEFIDDSKEEGGERGRWLKGAYMDGDEVWSKWRVLNDEVKRKKKNQGRTLFV